MGGMLAMGFFWLGTIDNPDPAIPILAPINPMTGNPDIGKNELDFSMFMPVFINEVFCTFIFVSVILMVKGRDTAGDRQGIAAAMTVVLTLLCCIASTNKFGAAFNPAVGVTLTTNAFLWMGNQHRLYHYILGYTFGPLTGGFAAGVFHNVHAKAFGDHDKSVDTSRDKDQ